MEDYKSLNVEMTQEHLKRVIAGAPINAIAELIWNALDADAKNVEIRFSYHGLEDVENMSEVVVKDDGHGIAYDKVEEYFGKYGRSQKTDSRKSPEGRTYHGKLGEGRYKAFSIGSIIEWETTYKKEDEFYTYSINLDASSQMSIKYSNDIKESEQKKTGTTVRIIGISEEKNQLVNKLGDNLFTVPRLLPIFAPYLNAYNGISIDYNGTVIDPKQHIEDQVQKAVFYQQEGEEYSADILIIRWKQSSNGQIYICGPSGVVYDELENGIGQLQKSLSLYVSSSYFEKMQQENTLALRELDPAFEFFIKEAKKAAREYIKTIEKAEAAKEIENIKDEGAYPFKDVPKTDLEKAEQGVFDVVAVEINRVVPNLRNSARETKKLTYQLIREAINTNPSSIKRILSEVFNLSIEQQDNLARLLDYSPLSSIIDTAKAVTDRLEFIYLLEEIVHNDKIGKPIKERKQFHRLLLKNLWIFGDQYELGTSDQSLKNVLKAHLSCLGRDEFESTDQLAEEDELKRIPDICLFHQACVGYQHYDHLVIELKRPTKVLTKKEVDQIEDYALKVAEDQRFDKATTKWHFILLGQDFDSRVVSLLQNKTVGPGNYFNNDDNVSVSILKWGEIIQKNKLRFEFLKNKLNFQISDDPDFAMKALIEQHHELFPNTTWSKEEND